MWQPGAVDPAENERKLRVELRRWRASDVAERLSALLGDAYDPDERTIAARRVRELSGLDVNPDLFAHLRRFHFEEVLLPARRQALGQGAHFELTREMWQEALDAAKAIANNSNERAADAAPKELHEHAERWFELAQSLELPTAGQTHLQFPQARELVRRELGHLGLSTILERCVRVLPAKGSLDLAPLVRWEASQHRANIVTFADKPEFDELLSAAGMAVALAAANSSLAWEYRANLFNSRARTFAHLLRLNLTSPAMLSSFGLSRREAEKAKKSSVAQLANVALNSSSAILGKGRHSLSLAWPHRFRAVTEAFRWWASMRELYDEDWFRNPRAGVRLRAELSLGGSQAAENAFSELSQDLGADFLQELAE